MGPTTIAHAALIAALLGSSAAWAGDPLSSLPDRGAVRSSDQLPILAAGAPRLQSTTAGAILGYVRNYPAGIWCDGVHDDTVALQAAINSGTSFDLPAGVCVTSATLTLSTKASHGQTIRGAGETAADGSGAGKTTIRPTAAVATAVKLDGSSFGGYLQGTTIEGLTLDMSSMAASSTGFQQLQAYDIRYARIRVTGDVGKTSWLFGPGAYTTSLNDIQGSLVYCLGNGVNNPTTITLVNPDINGLNVEQCASVTTIGGAVQPRFSGTNTVVYLPPSSSGLYGFGPIPPAGLYMALGTYALNAQFLTSLGTDWEALSEPKPTCQVEGWSFGTFDDGTHGCAPEILVAEIDSSVKNVSLSNSTFAGMYLYSPGGNNLALTGFGSSPATNRFGGLQSFGGGLELPNGQALKLYSDFAGQSQTGIIDAATGSAILSGGITSGSLTVNGYAGAESLGVQASANGNFLNFVDNAAHPIFGCFSGGARIYDSCYANTLIGYKDDGGSSQSWVLNGSSGVIQAGSELYPGSGTISSPMLTAAAGLLQNNGDPTPGLGNNGDYYFRGDCVHGTSTCLWHKEGGVWYALN